MGTDGQVYCDTVVPINILGLLTRLQTLHLSTGLGSKANEADVDLGWISSLKSLQDLSIPFGCSRSDVIQHATLLTNLTRLDIFVFCEHLDEAPVVNADIQWHRLRALQTLSICSVRLKLGDGFAGLLQLCHLSSIHFTSSTFDGKNNIASELLAALTNKFDIF